MNQPLREFVRRIGVTALFIWILFAGALASIAWGLSRVVRGLDFDLLALMLFVGANAGWLLARSRWRGRVVWALACLAALVSVFLRVGQFGDDILAIVVALVKFAGRIQFGQFDAQPLWNAFEPLGAGLAILLMRLEVWSRALVNGQPVADLAALALVWGFVLWLLAAWAAWMLRRAAQPFWAMLPLLLLFGFVLALTGRETLWLMVPLAALLGLMVMVPHDARQKRWERQDISAAQDLGFDLGLASVPMVLGILVVAILMPAFSPRAIARWVQEWTEPTENASRTISNSFGLEPAPRATTVFDTLSSPGLPRSHLLGAGPELLKTLALTIQTDDAAQGQPYYWRSTTYDIYTGRGWLTSRFQMQDYAANERVQDDSVRARTLHTRVRVAQPSGLVYAAGNVTSVDRAFEIARRTDGDVFAVQVNAETYRVESRVPIFRADELRGAGTNYPAWIQTQYLALPDDVPPRVLALARDLTATAPTPYDRAIALENYLRTIPYTLDLPTPPPDRDVTDYFLFDLRRGYCDYYATAMAVLARAAGLPARIAVGYATGEFDATRNEYVVTEASAHSWTQVYFPEYGWVDFEPTSARAVIQYDSPGAFAEPELPAQPEAEAGNVALARGVSPNAWYVLSIALLAIPFAFGVWMIFDSLRLARMTAARAVPLLYQRVFYLARSLGLPVTASATPNQVAALLADYFASFARPQKIAPWMHSAAQPIANIVELYVNSTYGAYAVSNVERAAAIQQWQRARTRAWLARAIHFFQAGARRVRRSIRA